jgi:hypothetical protein
MRVVMFPSCLVLSCLVLSCLGAFPKFSHVPIQGFGGYLGILPLLTAQKPLHIGRIQPRHAACFMQDWEGGKAAPRGRMMHFKRASESCDRIAIRDSKLLAVYQRFCRYFT